MVSKELVSSTEVNEYLRVIINNKQQVKKYKEKK